MEKLKSGRLTDAEKAEIERLVQTMKNPQPGPIARRLSRNPSTINWHMISRGMIERRVSYGRSDYVRSGGVAVRRYTEAEDKRIVALSVAGRTTVEIAAILAGEGGTKRTGHSVHNRLVMLGAYQDAEGVR